MGGDSGRWRGCPLALARASIKMLERYERGERELVAGGGWRALEDVTRRCDSLTPRGAFGAGHNACGRRVVVSEFGGNPRQPRENGGISFLFLRGPCFFELGRGEAEGRSAQSPVGRS